jgi:hypothetical protein
MHRPDVRPQAMTIESQGDSLERPFALERVASKLGRKVPVKVGFGAGNRLIGGQEERLAINDLPYIETLKLRWSRRLSHADRRRSKDRRGLV